MDRVKNPTNFYTVFMPVLVALIILGVLYGEGLSSDNQDDPSVWGRLKISGPKTVKAGSFQTFRITHEVGRRGIDDKAHFRLSMKTVTDVGGLQAQNPDQPNYMSATTTGDAKLELTFLTHGMPGAGVRPWEASVVVKVSSGYLKEGDQVVVTLGDRSEGSPGWRVQTFCESTFEIRGEVNPFGTGVFELIPDQLVLDIVPDEPVRAFAVAPSIITKRSSFSIRIRAEDKFGNPVGDANTIQHKGIAKEGIHRLDMQDPETGLKCLTNPIRVMKKKPDRFLYWADLHAQSEETVGINPLEDYLDFAKNKAFLDVFSNQGHGYQISEELWSQMEELMKRFYRPGEFVTFPGYEWSGNTGVGGDHNVYFKREGHKISRSSRTLVRDKDCDFVDSPTIEDLFRNYEGNEEVMVFAHVGGRWADIRRPDKDLSTAIEVHSNWGTFEWFIQDAFQREMRVAFVANSDDFRGRPGLSYPGMRFGGGYGGLTGIYAERLDRESIWAALKARRCFATSGARILLDVRMNKGILMGRIGKAEQAKMLIAQVHGTAPLERMEVRNGMKVVQTIRPYSEKDLGNRIKVLWNGAATRGRARTFIWDGNLIVRENRITNHSLVNFYGWQSDKFKRKGNQVEWVSATTGGNAGVILDLENKTSGVLHFQTDHVSFDLPIEEIGFSEKKYIVEKGLDTWVAVYRLPNKAVYDHAFDWRVTGLQDGDNPLFVHVVQEDGHRAWSSPIYVVKE